MTIGDYAMKKFVVILLITAALLSFVGCGKPSIEEEYVLESFRQLKKLLKDPDSLVIHEDIDVIIKLDKSDDNLHYYVYFDYGARNGFGGMERDTAIFRDSQYVGRLSDEVEEITSKNIYLVAGILMHSQKSDGSLAHNLVTVKKEIIGNLE
jgi:hypothetical protein